ncbi:hypothetical protein [Nocardioides iriomotensis]|uniref:Uncharacterized protein n=1 Tax=Nocardioides iriomotensis TaxID=715784 RepID=A0A4Q5J8E1_9ACTN|nr:hypothetical protein [Nocardioides iriomotensis]RYU14803.1 hypothetical protein ETU37_02100 [Nocardioides iriomotensis]
MTAPTDNRTLNPLQEARGLLADLAEQAPGLLTPDDHMSVLLAMDHLERAGLDVWGPPPPPTRIRCAASTLGTVAADLEVVLEDVTRFRVLSLPVGFAAHFVARARADS